MANIFNNIGKALFEPGPRWKAETELSQAKVKSAAQAGQLDAQKLAAAGQKNMPVFAQMWQTYNALFGAIPQGFVPTGASQGDDGQVRTTYGPQPTPDIVKPSELIQKQDPSGEWYNYRMYADGTERRISKATPKQIKAAGEVNVNVGQGKPAPSGERMELTKIYDFGKKLQRIDDLYDPSYAGPIEGRIKAGLETVTGVGVSERGISFRALVNELGDDLLRLKSGAQINEQEFQRLMKFLPNPNLPNKTFQSRLETFKTTMGSIIKTKEDALSASGFAIPRPGATPPQAPAQAAQPVTRDQEAINWANSNPQDPRAIEIKKRLGAQ